MTYYHDSKAEAQEAAESLEAADTRIASTRVELESGNGWVVVAVPRVMDLSDLYDQCEVRNPVLAGNRVSPYPSFRKKTEPVSTTPRTRSGGSSGGGGRGYSGHESWPLIAECHEKGMDRDAIIAAMALAGYNNATASKQTRHWLKSKGLWKK